MDGVFDKNKNLNLNLISVKLVPLFVQKDDFIDINLLL